MRKISAVMIMGFFLFIRILHAQEFINTSNQVKIIRPYPLTISCSKTTNIIFPYAIISVDRGSKDLLVQKAEGVQNILQIKAAKQNFLQTNLTVITADGKLNSFIIDYGDNPSVLNLSFSAKENKVSSSILLKTVDQAEVQKYITVASVSKDKVRDIKNKRFGMCIKLNGLFVHDDVMYLRISIANKTNINYDIDQLRFYIRDKKKAKRTASQEIEIKPLYTEGYCSLVAGQTERNFVYAFTKFTIPDKKFLAVELMEKNGGRHMKLAVQNKRIVRAQLLQ